MVKKKSIFNSSAINLVVLGCLLGGVNSAVAMDMEEDEFSSTVSPHSTRKSAETNYQQALRKQYSGQSHFQEYIKDFATAANFFSNLSKYSGDEDSRIAGCIYEDMAQAIQDFYTNINTLISAENLNPILKYVTILENRAAGRLKNPEGYFNKDRAEAYAYVGGLASSLEKVSFSAKYNWLLKACGEFIGLAKALPPIQAEEAKIFKERAQGLLGTVLNAIQTFSDTDKNALKKFVADAAKTAKGFEDIDDTSSVDSLYDKIFSATLEIENSSQVKKASFQLGITLDKVI